jgi:hypothetical protein
MDTYRQLNNEGVTLLCAGGTRAALVKFSQCLGHVKSTCFVDRNSDRTSSNSCLQGDDVRYTYVHHSALINESKCSEPCDERFVYIASVHILHDDASDNMINFDVRNSSLIPVNRAKLSSIVLYNLALAHHMLAIETKRKTNLIRSSQICIAAGDETISAHDREPDDSMFLFRKALVLYGLCRSALATASKISGKSTAEDVFQSIVIVNNMGDIYKEIHGPTSPGARSCSEQLVQVFMYYALKGDEPQMAQELGDILINAIQTLSGGCSAAHAA